MKLYEAPSNGGETRELLARVEDWRTLLESRPMPGGNWTVRYQAQPGESMSDAQWVEVATIIRRAISGLDDGAVARVRLSADLASRLIKMVYTP